jgi:4-hydroxy-tetrahydrodipicolinate reductase
MTIRVCVAGATGWAGSSLTKAIVAAEDMALVGAVSRSHAGKSISDVLDVPDSQVIISGSVEEALQAQPDVFVEYTKPHVALQNVLEALNAGCHVVIGTSGLSDQDYAQIAARAEQQGRGALAAGNFALTVVLLQKFAEMAARHIPHWEIVDYASSTKTDAPSGTARELAFRLGQIRDSALDVALEEVQGEPQTRGARLNGTQVHAIRLPGYVISVEVIFGMDDQKLILRHESGTSSQPYVDGAMLAIRKVSALEGLHRGLDTIMDFGGS